MEQVTMQKRQASLGRVGRERGARPQHLVVGLLSSTEFLCVPLPGDGVLQGKLPDGH